MLTLTVVHPEARELFFGSYIMAHTRKEVLAIACTASTSLVVCFQNHCNDGYKSESELFEKKGCVIKEKEERSMSYLLSWYLCHPLRHMCSLPDVDDYSALHS